MQLFLSLEEGLLGPGVVDVRDILLVAVVSQVLLIIGVG